MTEFFTLSSLGSLAGIVVFVSLMVEACKLMIPVYINPKWYCIGWSFVAMLVNALWLNPAATPADWLLACINALLIAATASGAFEYVIKPAERLLLEKKEANQQIAEPTDESGDSNE